MRQYRKMVRLLGQNRLLRSEATRNESGVRLSVSRLGNSIEDIAVATTLRGE
jgi:hypothetical protein